MKLVVKILGLFVCIGAAFTAVVLALMYQKYTPKYLDAVTSAAPAGQLTKSLAGLELSKPISQSKLKSCKFSAPPCLWIVEEHERAVAYKGKTPPAPDYAKPKGFGVSFTGTPTLGGVRPPPAGWDSTMSNYFRPRPSPLVKPVTATTDVLSGEQHWIVQFDSDRPLGWRGLDVRATTCNGTVVNIAVNLPLVSETDDPVAPLLSANPAFELAVKWLGAPDSTTIKRYGIGGEGPFPSFYPRGQESTWYIETQWATYSWFVADGHQGNLNPPYTVHGLSLMALPRVDCVSREEASKAQQNAQAQREKLEALKQYKSRDDAAVANDNAVFQ